VSLATFQIRFSSVTRQMSAGNARNRFRDVVEVDVPVDESCFLLLSLLSIARRAEAANENEAEAGLVVVDVEDDAAGFIYFLKNNFIE
jgi:hypothetical protein